MIKALEAQREGAAAPKDWSVYIVRCGDDSLYTGIAKNVQARIKQHNDGRGAAYTRARRPVTLAHLEPGLTRSQALVREAQIKRLPRPGKERLFKLAVLAAAMLLSAVKGYGAPAFTKEAGVLLSSAAMQAAAGAFPAQRLYFVRAGTEVFSATTVDGRALVEESGVRLSSLTTPSIDIAVSSITGLAVLPLDAGGFRMLYSVIGTTGAFRIYSATSADGLAWANDTGTAVNVDNGATFAGLPTLVELQSGDWRLYYIQNSVAGNSPADYRIFTALSTNEGRNWSTPSAALAQRAGAVSATLLTSNRVRLYYTAPLTGGTSDTVVLSALSTDVNGTTFNVESGIRLSTSPTGTLSHPFVARSTDTHRWRMYYTFLEPDISTGSVYSAASDAPDPQSVFPSTVFKNVSPTVSTVSGEVFSSGLTALLRRSGQADIPAAGVTVSDDQTFTATFDTQNKAIGHWDLIVTNANGQSTTLTNAVYVDFPGGSVVVTDNLLRPRQSTLMRADITIYDAGRVTAKIFTADGQPITTLFDEEHAEGTFPVTWNGRSSAGNVVASGLYLLRVKGPKLSLIDKIVVIK